MRPSYRVAALLFFSGMCALIYQVAWLRELRLIFGASTPASAAVLAVFMGGLGYGSLLLSRRADRAARPLRLYALLEGGIALTAALSPLLLALARAGYIAIGGTTRLGMAGGTVARLVLAAIVLLPPTLLMGGTLPAAARAATSAEDAGRRTTALLYGMNTLGAVSGAVVSTFFLLEALGARATLWVGCLANGIVAMVALILDASLRPVRAGARAVAAPAAPAAEPGDATVAQVLEPEEAPAELEAPAPLPAGPSLPVLPARARRRYTTFVLTAAAGTGFVFLLMELVWYRMLGPLLGGSSYTFGLILAVALLGIGLGGLGYALFPAKPRLGAFAVSCALEAVLIAVPFALGDRVALFTITLRDLGVAGLGGHVLGWGIVTAVLVLPGALVAGYQFPLLIGLLGRADTELGRHIGLAYAFNTAGSILGSLAGGFFLFPGLGALGAWKLVVWLLCLLGVGAVLVELSATRASPRAGPAARAGSWGRSLRSALFVPVVLVAAALALVHLPLGPTQVWRHSPIGAGREDQLLTRTTRNKLRYVLHEKRRGVTREWDGRESTIGLYTLNDTAFLNNGKSDGAAVMDSGTQVMGGLIGAMLHPGVRRALVIGLGTGSTAGWLGAIPDIERVDAVELEPAIREVARICTPVNHDVLGNPKVHLTFGDAREVLLTTPERYDLVFSEPSNPYRAGVASLFTEEFYQAVKQRLAPGGVFAQWVQAYEIDADSIRTIYATLSRVFGSVESWRTKEADLVLIARDGDDVPLDLGALAARIAEEPWKTALYKTWRVDSVEGVLAHYVARPSLARAVAAKVGPAGVNTDDHTLLEFAFARALGKSHSFDVDDLRETAHACGELWPEVTNGSYDLDRVQDAEAWIQLSEWSSPVRAALPEPAAAVRRRYDALKAWFDDKPDDAIKAWAEQPRPPEAPLELLALADSYAIQADERALPLIGKLRAAAPTEALALEVRMAWAKDRKDEAYARLEDLVLAYRDDPFASTHLVSRVLPYATELVRGNAARIAAMFELLDAPFALEQLRYLRVATQMDIGMMPEADPSLCVRAVAAQSPFVPWERDFLARRVQCFERAGHPDLERARLELAEYDAGEPTEFGRDLCK
ncbi:MAG: fused MFS/spermidine synthase [Myxococcales bacterium]|nr:fused MFS/spermidine synthase [Myxococcales bacterium]